MSPRFSNNSVNLVVLPGTIAHQLPTRGVDTHPEDHVQRTAIIFRLAPKLWGSHLDIYVESDKDVANKNLEVLFNYLL